VYAANAGSLIEVVNKVGSLFYGTLLGAFVLAIGTKRANGTGTFVGMLAGFSTVLWAAAFSGLSYLWYNVLGALVVVVVGLAVSTFRPRQV
jgi:Na+/proline symporter